MDPFLPGCQDALGSVSLFLLDRVLNLQSLEDWVVGEPSFIGAGRVPS